jgi:hypothetical protein
MKKILVLLIFLSITSSLFGQQIQKWHKVTNYISTSEMVWSQLEQETMFFDNHDLKETIAVWDITLDVVSGDGFVTSGKITYRVNEATIEERDGISMVVMKAYNETLNLPVLIIASTIEGKFKLGVYVEAHKKVYYFYE